MKARFSTRIAALVASAGLVAGLGACSSNDDSTTSAGKSEDTIKVVTSTKVWADVADAVTDDEKVAIDPIIASNDIDPHSYEPAAADMAKVEDADILVAGGGHYDAWLTSSLRDAKDKVIISALPQEEGHNHDHDHEGHDHEGHDHDHEGHDHDGHDHDHGDHDGHEHHHHDGEANEHVWYDTDAVEETAEQLAEALTKMGAKADTKAVDKEIKDIEEAKSKLKAAKVAQVHPLADDILKDTKVEDITPKGYRQSTLNESEPSASDVNEMLKLIESGELDYLIDSPQTHDQVSQRLVEAAKAKGVKIVDVFESPSADQSFFDLYKQTLSDMESA
ncbi:zinc ABC transporter substrate-binding protein [Corynebacterium amycolatum]|uniref:Zinc ABC transporter substrate-binding protein n=1 Tax=Corynebacterium amycolatum TaxID=43765 RepID=A0AB37GI84_CORAY|nr:zinc ABC transporter substrate-binding protein [Corynebacterium amycolatum]MCQ9127242.1 zinc ABC transporter substrate-binding protein [Corynebacterium amycolatum]MCQ9141448.1 zinc ABC transporter substrate-binding protein [Corynebacterium amycolatum]QPR31091.1 zinc ABC transporter substrate-binding protein [Corynebacterium amycolatum]QQB82968.1 zinc ABC transporter substrate-binding protein [Corynebacterium amycolatum]QQV00537.1 zinc ABC transporter substrate-binding protein [Corynebacteri